MDTDTCDFEVRIHSVDGECREEPCGETAAWRLWYLRESATCCEQHKEEALREFADRLKLPSTHHVNRETLDTQQAVKLCAMADSFSTALKARTYTMLDDTYLVRISKDGDQWSALVGENLQEGLAGFAPTIAEALRKLADEWEQYGFQLAPKEESHG